MNKLFFGIFIGLIVLIAFSEAQQSGDNADFDMFSILYDKISDIVSPGATQINKGGTPTSVYLAETPGRAINRDDYDPVVWARNNFRDRQPSAVAAALVDRAPRYLDMTFTDSGSRISAVWGHLMRQYVVPFTESDLQKEKLAEAREKLFNSTLEEDFFDALNTYESDFRASLASREACLAANGGEICSQLLLLDELRLSNSWFNMEVRRRDLHGAQSMVLAIQVQDLSTIFADALRKFERQKRIDVGAVGFGTEFYQTFFEPSDWWRWWSPSFANNDLVIPNDQTVVDFLWGDVIDVNGRVMDTIIGGGETVSLQVEPSQAVITNLDDTGFTYNANLGYQGFDRFVILNEDTNITATINVNVGGITPGSAGSAFSSVTYSTSESSSSYETATTTLTSRGSFSAGGSWYWRWWFGASGGTRSFSTSTTSEWSQQSSSTTISFEVAKVSIQRPWIDTSLLSFRPVAIRGLQQYQWSDGTGLPNEELVSRFPLLPTDFVVTRNIVISSDKFTQASSSMTEASRRTTSSSFSIGFWRFGYSRTQGSTSKNSYQSSSFQSSANSQTLTIDGPQIVGWVCTPLPKFPTASSDYVEKLVYGEVITPYDLVETDTTN